MYEAEPPILKAWSVGFIPGQYRGEGAKNELLEVSAVAVPANANALTIAKGMNPEEEKEIGKEIKEWVIKSVEDYVDEKPYPNEHACRLVDPAMCDKFRRDNGAQEHNGKKYDVIFGEMKDDKKWVEQAFRYPKDDWTASEAKTHCTDHDGSFEAASSGKQEEMPEGKPSESITVSKEEDKPVEEKPIGEPLEVKPEEIEKPKEEPKEPEINVDTEEKEGRVISTKNRETINQTISKLKETTVALENLLQISEPPQKEAKEIEVEIPEKSKGDGSKGRNPKEAQKLLSDEVIVRALQKIAKTTNFALYKSKRQN
jgi:hypothetical protein